MTIEQMYDRLARGASMEGDDAAIQIRSSYAPVGGSEAKVFPPTYPGERRGESLYVVEERYIDGTPTRTVLLDATQSQANRCEEALAAAVSVPHVRLDFEVEGARFSVTSLEAPHRSRDAYFRDSVMADTGQSFDESAVGRALAEATDRTPLAYYRYAPADLVYGSWDSHRGKRRATRFARAYTSEMFGIDPKPGRRGGARMDPFVVKGDDKVSVPADPTSWELNDKGKNKLSEVGHGMIPPSLNPVRDGEVLAGGGVAVSAIRRKGVLGFASLARLRLVSASEAPSPEAQRAGRAALAALALLGDRLAFGAPAIFLRSGCELMLAAEELVWLSRSGEESLELSPGDARALFDQAVEVARNAGLPWAAEPVRLRPKPNLEDALTNALTIVDIEGPN